MKGVLVVEGHVQGLSNVRSLGEQGIPVYVADENICLAQFSKFCKKSFRCPPYKSDEFIDWLINTAEKENLQDWCIIPSNDHIVQNISKNKERIEKYYKIIVPDTDILDNIVKKKNLLNKADACGIPIPATCYPENVNQNIDKLRFPVLIKGNEGLSFYKITRQKAIQVDNLDDLTAKLNELKNLNIPDEQIMIQELIPFCKDHKVISFTAFSVNGEIKTHWSGIKIHEHPINYGTATCAQSIFVQEILDISIPLLKTLNYTGVCEIEYLWDKRDNQYKLIEINPRTWLWVGLAKACGINYALMIYNFLNNKPIDFKQNYEIGTKWINYITNIFYCSIAIIKKKFTLREYFNSLKGKKVNALRYKNDNLPAFMFVLLIFYIFKKRS